MLSRIDGQTPWGLLREIGGLPPAEVDQTLERWIQEGVVEVDADPPAAETSVAGERVPGPADSKPEPTDEIDPCLDISEDLQRRILILDAELEGRSYFELLGVARDADAKAIKRAYFGLSKEFHPDRYFRREIGDYASRLGRVFKKIVEAYELLSDPTTRKEIESTLLAAPVPSATGADGELAAEAPGGYRKPSRMENLERLRRRFRVPPKLLAERQFRAAQFFQAAQIAASRESWLEAAASARLAIAFDPWNPEYKHGFAGIQAQVHRVRADELLERAAGEGAQAEALALLEEALHFRPTDGAANRRAAELALQLGEPGRAREFADAACEFEPEVVASHVVLARVLRREGDIRGVRDAIARAEKIDPEDPDLRAERRLAGRG